MEAKSLPAQVKAAREAKKLTIPALARKAGVVRNTVARIESGGSINLEHLHQIASALGHEVRLVRVRKPQVTNKLKVTGEHDV